MLKVQEKSLERLMAQLDGMGVAYAIVVDGIKYGALELAPEKKPRVKRQRSGIDFSQFNIIERVRAMQIGDVLTIDVPEGIDVEKVRGNLCAAASKHVGKGCVTSCVCGRQVQALREA